MQKPFNIDLISIILHFDSVLPIAHILGFLYTGIHRASIVTESKRISILQSRHFYCCWCQIIILLNLCNNCEFCSLIVPFSWNFISTYCLCLRYSFYNKRRKCFFNVAITLINMIDYEIGFPANLIKRYCLF